MVDVRVDLDNPQLKKFKRKRKISLSKKKKEKEKGKQMIIFIERTIVIEMAPRPMEKVKKTPNQSFKGYCFDNPVPSPASTRPKGSDLAVADLCLADSAIRT